MYKVLIYYRKVLKNRISRRKRECCKLGCHFPNTNRREASWIRPRQSKKELTSALDLQYWREIQRLVNPYQYSPIMTQTFH